MRGGLGHLGHVEGEFGDDFTRRPLIEIARRQREKVAEHGSAQVHDHSMRDPTQADIRDIGQHTTCQKQPDQRHRDQ